MEAYPPLRTRRVKSTSIIVTHIRQRGHNSLPVMCREQPLHRAAVPRCTTRLMNPVNQVLQRQHQPNESQKQSEITGTKVKSPATTNADPVDELRARRR